MKIKHFVIILHKWDTPDDIDKSINEGLQNRRRNADDVKGIIKWSEDTLYVFYQD
jgi:hypothetical protein